jgi:hypothetical protein
MYLGREIKKNYMGMGREMLISINYYYYLIIIIHIFIYLTNK